MSNRSFVLLAVDDGRDSRSTAEFAVAIARQRAADVRAVQVVPRVVRRSIAPPEDLNLRATLRALRRAGDRDGVRVRHIRLTGTPERAIPAYAQLTEAGVIVVGRNYGTSNLWRSTSVVRRLSRSASVPVIVVPPQRSATDAAPSSLTHIVAAVDFTVASAVALRTAVELAREHGARLTMLHAMGVSHHMAFGAGEAWRMMHHMPGEARMLTERLTAHAAAFGAPDVDPVVVTGEPAASITEKAADSAADLIVMGVAPRHWLDEVVFGSTLRAVLRKAKTPVLVLPVVAGAHGWIDSLTWERPGTSAAGATVPQLAA